MRSYGALNPIDQIPYPPDTVETFLLASSVSQISDWAGSTVGAADAAAHLVRFSGMTTGKSTDEGTMRFMVNLISTHVINPTSGSSITTGTTAGSTGNSMPVLGSQTFQIPSFSTGYSVISPSSGYVFAEIWKK